MSGERRVSEREEMGYAPGVFVRVANTRLTGTEAVKVARKGLKVAVFAAICGWLVRVANKGFTEAFCL
jgi:hypothetical protein